MTPRGFRREFENPREIPAQFHSAKGRRINELSVDERLDNGAAPAINFLATKCFIMQQISVTPPSKLACVLPLAGFLMLMGLTVLFAPHMALAAPVDDYSLALGLYRKGRWDQAAEQFKKFLDANPQAAEAASAQLYLGLSLVNSEDYREGREVLRKYVRRNIAGDNLADAYYRIGECSYFLNDLPTAEADLETFLAKYPQHELRSYALPYLGDAELRLGKPLDAAGHFKQSLIDFPRGRLADEAKFGLARAAEASHKLEDAAVIYRELAAGQSSRADDARLWLGSLEYSAGRYEQAAKEFQLLVEKFPESSLVPTAHLNAGFALYRKGDPQAAITELTIAGTSPGSEAAALHWIGMSEKALKHSSDAAKAFEAVVTNHNSSPLAAESLFEWAELIYRERDYSKAATLFDQLATMAPKGNHAAEALYYGAAAAAAAGGLDAAEERITRLQQQFPRDPLYARGRLLLATINLQRSQRADVTEDRANELRVAATQVFSSLIESSEPEVVRNQARFELARFQEMQGQPQAALKTLEPLAKVLLTGAGEPAEALLVAGRASLALKNAPAAEAAATAYLNRVPEARRLEAAADQGAALALRAAARLMERRSEPALADWRQMLIDLPAGEFRIAATRDLAERAYATEQWPVAAELFDKLLALTQGTATEATALSGLGWSRFQEQKYAAAAETFGTLLKNFPTAEPLAPEAAYLRGKALQETGDLKKSAEAYRTAFEMYAPAIPVAAGAESEGTARNVYLAGLQLARVLRLEQQIDEADAAYAKLLELFPRPRNLPALLEEWALLHYEAEDYVRSDAIYARLLKEAPASEQADNARLNLAESALFNGKLGESKSMLSELIGSASASVNIKQRAMSLLIGLAAQQQEWQEVQRLGTAFLKQYPKATERAVVLHQLGEAQLQLNEPAAAQESLLAVAQLADEPAIRSQPWFPRTYILLGEVAFQQKRYDDAEKYIEQVAAIEPQPPYAYLAEELLGRVLKNRRKFDESRDAFERVLNNEQARGTETAARAQYEVAQTYFLQERWDDAQTAAFKVYTLYAFPEWQAPALYMAGTCDDALGKREQALKTYRDVVKEFPQSSYAQLAEAKLKRAQTN